MEGYLVEIPEREHEAIRRLLELHFIHHEFFMSLGLTPFSSWYILQVRQDRLVEEFKGDIDILAGRIIRNESGSIKWPPITDYLVGVEAKCAYLHPEANEITADNIKSKKSSEQKIYKIQKQVEALLCMGFNKVALLDAIANPPASGIDGQAWLTALSIAGTSMEQMMPVLQRRLPENSPAGHWVWSIGSVVGGDETIRGTGTPIKLRTACENLILQEDLKTKSRRREIEHKLNAILANLPTPPSLPAIFIDCRNCGKIHKVGLRC